MTDRVTPQNEEHHEETEEEAEEDQENGIGRLYRRCTLTVEPIVLGVVFSKTLTGNYQVNLLETVACLRDLGLGKINCTQPLSDHVEDLVQPETVYLNSCVSIIQSFIPSILSLFIGPWSDRNGRKPFILISLCGYGSSYALWGILSCMRDIDLGYYMLPSVIQALTGGMVAIVLCTNCYIADISTNKNRAFRLTLVASVSLIGSASGYVISVKIFSLSKDHGYAVIFFTASMVCFIVLFYTLFLLKETINKNQNREKNLLKIKFLKESFKFIVEEKIGYSRLITLILMFITFLSNYLSQGEGSVKYLALKKAYGWVKGYGWTLESFDHYRTVSDIVCVGTTCGGVILLKLIKLPDLWITLLAATILAGCDVVVSFTTNTEYFWIFSLVSSVAGLIEPTVLSELSKSVPQESLGTVFAFDASMESLAPLSAPPVYSAIYTMFYVHHPLYIYLFSAAIAATLGALTGLVVILKMKKMKKHRGTGGYLGSD